MSEANEIKRLGARAQKNSGRGWREKGDATLGSFLIDVKESAKSFSLNRKVWAKVCSDAFRERRKPGLWVVLGEGNDKVRLLVIEGSVGQEMLELWEKENASVDR